jgi:FixJ family two-component response regulator
VTNARVIAIVDDDPSVRRALRRLVQSAGYMAQTFASARQFLDWLPRGRAGCLVLDIHLNGMSGFDLQERLVADGAGVPVIFITAHDDTPTRERIEKSGAAGHLWKPVDDQALLGAIGRALEVDRGLVGQPKGADSRFARPTRARAKQEGKPMGPQEPDILRDRGRSLEEEFFRREDQRLIARLNELKAAETTREALAKASGITKPAVLDTLIELGIRAETVAALSIVPLVEVAWADGTLDPKERRAVLDRARVASGSTEHVLIEAWLDRRPDPELLTAWTHLIQGICDQLGPDEVARLKMDLLERARSVASASGGVLGMGSKVSSAEAAMLAELEAAFARRP